MKNMFLTLMVTVISVLSITPVNANQMIVKQGVVFMATDNVLTVAADSSGGLPCVFTNGFFKAGATADRINVAVQGAKFIEFKNDYLYVATSKQGVVNFEKFDVSACLTNHEDVADNSSSVHADLGYGRDKGPCAMNNTMPSALRGTCRPGEL